jgi:hypothetical protein
MVYFTKKKDRIYIEKLIVILYLEQSCLLQLCDIEKY